jgi:beta-mannanase
MIASLVVVVMAALATPLTSSTEARAAVRATGPLAPANGALFGAHVRPLVGSTVADRQDAVTQLETDIGRKLRINHRYYGWGSSFPTAIDTWDLDNGRIPMLTWGEVDVATVNGGGQDAYIRARADAVKNVGRQIFLRWFAHMDGDQWASKARSPSAFISAWRRIYGIFQNRGATNAVFVWCPTAAGFASGGDAAAYYPGDAYVHWTCADGFNYAPGKVGAPWRTFAQIYQPFYAWGSGRPKPMMVGETGAQERLAGEKAQWITDARNALKNSFPNIQAFVYHHARTDYDWRANTTPGAYDAFRAMGLDLYFRPGTTTGGGGSGGNTLFGARVQPDSWTEQGQKNAITGLESRLGRPLDIDQHYYKWDEVFPTWREPWDLNSGRIPLITWAGTHVSGINSGSKDTMIRNRADAVKGLGGTVFIRWFSEADARAHEAEAGTASAYINAYRRIIGIFNNRGATNVRWVWCGTAHGFSTGRAQTFYPGDAYIDWTCADGFNWAPVRDGAEWTTFSKIFSPFYAWASKKTKPIMIAETGVLERNAGEKGQWITDARNTIKTSMPKIRAFVYFDAYARDFSGTFYDWQVDTTLSSFDAFKKMGLDLFFQPSHTALLG